MSSARKITLAVSVLLVAAVFLATRSNPSSAANAPVQPAGPVSGLSAVIQVNVPHTDTRVPSAPAQTRFSAPLAPQDTPDTLVSGGVTEYTIAAPKLFWHTGPAPCPPHGPTGANQSPTAPADNFIDSIGRIAVQGSLTRTVYFQQLVCDGLAGQILSKNIVADANYLYFTTATGLYRLSVNANVGDPPELMNALVSGYAELAIDDTNIFLLTYDGSNNTTLSTVDKSTKAYVSRSGAGVSAGNLQVSYSYWLGTEYYFAYWLQGGVLHRFNMDTASVTDINPGSNVYAYYPEGGLFYSCGLGCFGTSDLIYLSTGQVVKTYNNRNDTFGASNIYDAGTNNAIYDLVTDGNQLFMLQSFTSACGLFSCYTDYVVRHARSASASADYLYFSSTGVGDVSSHIALASDYIFWQDSGQVLRLPKTAGALPTTNVRITGLEITQGIQKPDNSVRLIQDKRTFVRLFVQSDGGGVPGVTALLDGWSSSCGSLDSLLPVNDVGTNLTVWPAPQRANLNDSFLFELPWSWTTCGPLTVYAHLNPFHAPPESNYGDNDWSDGPFNFSASPRLQVQFIAWQYVLFNQFHTPQYVRDIMETYSWVRRVYPVNGTPGFNTDSSPGFRPGLWFVGDDSLGAKVQGSDPSCQDLYYKDKNGKQVDNRNLCASRYTNQQMVAMRSENGLPDNLFFYGMLADTKNPQNQWVFPRGQACCGTAVSSGPVGADGAGGYFTYNGDGTYGDWYAAHEIGHTLGRNHPVTKGSNAANRACGQSEDDGSYPYNYAQIGVDDNTEGFDAGDASLHQPKRIYPGTQWFDVMSYCANQWISDYTYEAMYQYMLAHPTSAPQANAPMLSGNWLAVQGTIISGTNIANFNRLRHLSTIASLPPLVAGGYTLRLLNASNGQLANYGFKPDPLDGSPDVLMFNQVVTFVAGTAKVQIVRTADNFLLTSFNVPAQAPTLSNVALPGAPNPVSGIITLTWTANDPVGLPLKFDIYYSGTLALPLQLVKSNVSGASTQIDTTKLGGGPAFFRVVANDGFNTVQANSPIFTMANKRPQPFIDTPGNGLHIHYGQVVNFSGEALDAQDGGVTGAGLVWTYQKGSLGTGTGALQTVADLPVGTNTITLTATNSKGLSAATSITITVDDDLSLLNSTLTAGPTQFGWTFPAGSTTTQTATLSIGNAGAGTLNWTASSDAAWLTLSASSGTAPSSIVVTAHPNGIPAGTDLLGNIRVSASGQPTITIPATIVVGSMMDKGINYLAHYIYLPLIRK
jgi:Viral BACON domain/Metallo-peptidase family M12B Reprolysin-like